MPVAARADSEYLAGTLCGGSRISLNEGSHDEHPSASLRHSEETAVENPPAQAVPEVGQRGKHDSEVPTAVRGEEPGYVLDENPSGSNKVNDTGELEEQAASLAGESGAASGDGEVLARKSAAEEIKRFIPAVARPLPLVKQFGISYIVVDGDSGPAGGEHLAPVGVGLAEKGVLESGPVEAVVHASDPAEQ
jgi:hypothetical protein